MIVTDAEYLDYDPFFGEEGDLTCRTAAIRTARKVYACFGGDVIQPGDRYRYEKALVDGDFWGTYRICLPCLEKWIRELDGDVECSGCGDSGD